MTLRQFSVTKHLNGFAVDRSGNVASLFAVALVPILAAAGAALDYADLARNKSRLQSSVDAAALAVAAARLDGQNQRVDLARKTALANFATAGGSGAVVVTLSEPQPGNYKVDGSAHVPLTFARLVGIGRSTVHASAQSQSEAGGGTVEVAMAVDVSGSMRHSDMSGMARIDTLKQVANTLVDTLSARVPASQLKFATIPFTTNVNIGRGNTAYVDGANHALFTGTSWAGCVFERAPPNHLSTGYDGSGSPATGKFRAFIAPPEPDQGSGYACINPSNGTNAGYASIQETNPSGGPYSAETNGPNFHCVRHALQPLTSSVADVKAKIDSLTAEPNWGTIVTPGLVWALRALTPNAPFPGAAPFSPNNKKVIIALTDGAQVTDTGNRDAASSSTCAPRQNSASPYRFAPGDLGLAGRTLETNGPRDVFNGYGYLFDSDPFGRNYLNADAVDSHLDELLIQACAQARSQTNVEIFTIAVSPYAGPGTRAHTALSQCASDSNHFFYAPDATAMAAAFESIATQVAPRSRVRLTR